MSSSLKILVGFGLVWLASIAQGMSVTIDATGDTIDIPEDWRPIPRAEVEEVRERIASTGVSAPPIVAAFQKLPTLQWFHLPYLVVRVNEACQRPREGLAWESLAEGLWMRRDRGPIERVSGYRVTARACYDLEYLASDSDVIVFIGMMKSLGSAP